MIESPAQILRRHGLRPKHSWGQNFLADEDALYRIAQAAELKPDQPVVELGPGLGHLTRFLLATGARVTAVERDRDMVKVLTEELKDEKLRVISGNAAQTRFAEAAGVAQVTVVGNLPYHLSSPILFEVLEQYGSVQRAVFTLQKEVVERISAEPGGRDYGLLSVLLGLFFEIEELFILPASLFHPPPKVDSAVLRLTRLAKPRAEVKDGARFIRVVKAGFAQRRKTLLNSLKSDRALSEKVSWPEVLAKAGIDGTRRGETLSVEEFAAIERAIDV